MSPKRFVKPENAVTHFHLLAGDKVADFGAGPGFFLKALSSAVGIDGRVYACEIQKGLVDKLATLAREKKLSNVEPLWCDIEADGGTKLADGILDVGILVNTLYQLEDRPAALAEIARTIRAGGKLFVIDWYESFGGIGPKSDHVISEDGAKELVEAVGFRFERPFDAGEHHYGLAFRRV